MKALSHWAKQHPRTTIFLIMILHILAGLNALVLGILLSIEEWAAPRWLVLLFVHLFFLAYVLYPSRSGRRWSLSYSYARQKALDFTLVLAASLTIAFGVSRLWISPTNEIAPARAHFMNYEPAGEKQIESSRKVTRLQLRTKKRQIRKQIRQELREIRKSLRQNKTRQSRDWNRFLLIFLGVSVSLLLALILAGLSCSIACSGQEGLALVVFIGGGVGIIWLFVIWIKHINRKLPRIKPPEADTNE